MTQVLQVRSSDPDERRRGAILISICGLLLLVCVLIGWVINHDSTFKHKDYGLCIAAAGVICYALGAVLSRTGRVNFAGAFTSFAISSLCLLSAIATDGITLYVGFCVATPLIAGLVANKWVILPLTFYNICGTLILSVFTNTPQAPELESSLITVLVCLNAATGLLAWAYASTNGIAFAEVLAAQKALQVAQKKERIARRKAEHANQIKSAFLANMSHELRTPLNAIIGYSEMTLEEVFDPSFESDVLEVGEDVRLINQAGKHLLTLINDVLDPLKGRGGTHGCLRRDLYPRGLFGRYHRVGRAVDVRPQEHVRGAKHVRPWRPDAQRHDPH